MKNIILLPKVIDDLRSIYEENNVIFENVPALLQREFSPKNRGLLYREEGKQIKIWSKKIALVCVGATEKNSLKVVSVRKVKDYQYHFILERGNILSGNWSFIMPTETHRLEKNKKSQIESSMVFIEDELRKNNQDSFSIEDGLAFEKYVAYWENHDIVKKYQEEALLERKISSVAKFKRFTFDFDNQLIKLHLNETESNYNTDENIVVTSKLVWEKYQQLGNAHLKTLRGFSLGRVKRYKKNERLIVIQSKISIIERLMKDKDLQKGYLWVDDIGAKSKLHRESEALKTLFRGESVNKQLKNFMPEIASIKNPIIHKHVKTELLSDKFHQFKDKQKEAVLGALNTNDIYLIQGPPGTGKTTVISEIIQYLANDNQKVLLSSQTNLAVDNVLQRIGREDNVRAIRIGPEEKFELDSIQYSLEHRVENLQKEITMTLEERPGHFRMVKKALKSNESLLSAHLYIKAEIKKIINMKQNLDTHNTMLAETNIKYDKLKNDLTNLQKDIRHKYEAVGEKTDILVKLSALQNSSQNSLQQNMISAEMMSNLNLSIENTSNLRMYKGLVDEIQVAISEVKSLKQNRTTIISKMEQIAIEMQQTNERIVGLKVQYDDLSEQMKTYLMNDVKKLMLVIDDLQMDLHEYKYQLVKIDEKILDLNNKALNLRNLALEIKVMIDKSISQNRNVWEKYFGTSSITKEKFIDLWVKVEHFKKEFSSLLHHAHLLSHLGEHDNILIAQNEIKEVEQLVEELQKEKQKKKKYVQKFEESLTVYEQNEYLQLYLTHYQIRFSQLTIQKDLARTEEFISTYELNKKELELYEMTLDIQDEWEKKLQYYQESFEDIYINSSNLICATCLGIASTKNNHFLNTEFDYVILDEAARASSMELLIPLIRGKKIILVGDHKQISPTLERDILEKLERDNVVNTDEINKVYKKSLFGLMYEDAHDQMKTFLNKQFRMSPGISHTVSKYYYDNNLLNGDNVHQKQHTLESVLPKAFYWVDTPNTSQFLEKKENKSFYNEGEILAISSILDWLNNHLQVQKSVGIISPYKAQMNKLLETINIEEYKMLDIEINTVDAFQGREKNIVINSLVRNNSNGVVGHIRQDSRMNVALSRAQELSIFIGNVNFVSKNKSKVYKINSMIDDLKIQNTVLHVNDFLKDGETVWS